LSNASVAGIALIDERWYDGSVLAFGDDVIEAYSRKVSCKITWIEERVRQQRPKKKKTMELTLGGKLMVGGGLYRSWIWGGIPINDTDWS
jgi:hypothetical protein